MAECVAKGETKVLGEDADQDKGSTASGWYGQDRCTEAMVRDGCLEKAW
jgi:hypothetical protein